eukprot:TRINITY_DN1554_c0_g2_i1.p1 TRINITY_DN1554_c0_g2~~TRINITY_DN1554_c0_g2_i1.p1  ORF type:complete len:590 (-),score=46.10 TRINITY_DN1554_c0_g2_i1:394-2163(-)
MASFRPSLCAPTTHSFYASFTLLVVLSLLYLNPLFAASVCSTTGVPANTLFSPQNEPDKAARAAYLKGAKINYTYVPSPFVPQNIGGAWGGALAYSEAVALSVITQTWIANFSAKLGKVPYSVSSLTKLSDYVSLYKAAEALGLPKATVEANNSLSDEFFARTRFTSNPAALSLAKKLPFALTDTDVKGLLDDGDTLADALAAGRLYISDHSDFHAYFLTQGIPGTSGGAAIALFYFNSTKLMPLAIKPDVDSDLVYTPNDAPYDWMLAKMFFGNADGFMLAHYHFADTHLPMGAVHSSALRTMSPSHPVMALLSRHAYGVHGLNIFGYTALWAPGGAFGKYSNLNGTAGLEYMLKLLETGYTFYGGTPRNELRARGLRPLLPKHTFYRQAIKLYDAINSMVKAYVKVYYPTFNDVVHDQELQAWAKEVATQHRWLKGFPTRFLVSKNVEDVLTLLIYKVAVKHHGLNTYSAYSNIDVLPTFPFSIFKALPLAKGLVTASNIVEWLPSLTQSLGIMGFTLDFARPMAPGDLLGDYTGYSIYNTKTACLIKDFQAKLTKISIEINAEAAKETVLPFTNLDPKQLPAWVFI